MARLSYSLPAFVGSVALAASGLVAVASPASSSSWPIVSGGYSLDTLAYEGFDYTASTPLAGLAGGTGWSTPWDAGQAGDSPLTSGSTALTYTGHPVSGLGASYGGGWRALNANARDLPRVASGVVFVQFLVNLSSGFNNGAPNLRFFDNAGAVQTGAIGSNNTGDNASILSSSLTLLSNSGVSMRTGTTTLLVARIDHNSSRTDLWVNPDLSSFDYANPPASQASADGFAPTFDRVWLGLREGTMDEIRIMRLVAPAPPPPPAIPPSAPEDVTAVAGDAQALVSWSSPSRPGSYTVTHYQVMADPSGRTCLVTTTSCEVSGLTNGVTYTFRVRALTGAGWGAWSTPSPAATPTAAPRPTVVISGSRGEIEGRSAVSVVGRVTDVPEGTLLHPWLRMERNTSFAEGSARIGISSTGAFRWQRRTSRPISVYMASPDGSLRSNTVTIR